jgi:peroxiredoxin
MNHQQKIWLRLLSIFLFLMVFLNGILLYQNYHLKKDKKVDATSSLKNVTLPKHVFKNLEDKEVDIVDTVKKSNLSLLVFFSLNDCAACLAENSLWQKIYQQTGINVIGIAEHLNEFELKGWVENSGLTFPVLYDKDRKFTNEIMGITETPLKILVDNSAKIVLTDPVRIYKNEQEEFLRKLEGFVK